jgi:hypothetical protein
MTRLADLTRKPGYYSNPHDQWIAKEIAKANGDTQHQLAQDLAAINRLASYANLRDGGNMPRPDYASNIGAIVLYCALVALPGIIWAIWEWWL